MRFKWGALGVCRADRASEGDVGLNPLSSVGFIKFSIGLKAL